MYVKPSEGTRSRVRPPSQNSTTSPSFRNSDFETGFSTGISASRCGAAEPIVQSQKRSFLRLLMICEDVPVPAKLLTVERTESGVLDIHLDEAGATELMQVVQRTLLVNENAHDHLMSSGWGGTELTDEVQTEGATLVQQVNVHLWRRG